MFNIFFFLFFFLHFYFWSLMHFQKKGRKKLGVEPSNHDRIIDLRTRKKKRKWTWIHLEKTMKNERKMAAQIIIIINIIKIEEKANWFTQMRAKWISPFFFFAALAMICLWCCCYAHVPVENESNFLSWCVSIFNYFFSPFFICFVCQLIIYILCDGYDGMVTFAFFTV